MTEENAELLLGSKANRGLLPAALPRLRRSHSSLPSIPYYDSQISSSNLNAADMSGYGDALALQPVPESDAAAEEGEHVRLISLCSGVQGHKLYIPWFKCIMRVLDVSF